MPRSGLSTTSGSKASTRRRRLCPIPPTIIGIDQSFTRTGIVVWNGSVIWASDVKTTPTYPDEYRIGQVASAVIEALEACKPDAGVIEGYSTGPRSGRKVLTRLGELGGVIKFALWTYGVPFSDPAPSQLKLWSTGFGDADKKIMLRSARKHWPDCPHHDLADAFHLARMGQAHFDDWFA